MSSQKRKLTSEEPLETKPDTPLRLAPDGLILVDSTNGNIVDCNAGFEKLAGRPLSELRNMKVWDLRPAYLQNEGMEIFARLQEEEFMGLLQGALERPDGSVIPVEFRTWRVELDGKIYIQSLSRDISERKRSEDELRKSEERYKAFFDQAPDMCFIIAPNGIVKDVNRVGAQYLGYHTKELLGREVWGVVHPDDLEEVRAQVAEIFRKKRPKSQLEFRKVRKNGSILYVHEHTQLTLNDRQEPDELLIICRDVTERHQAQQELEESEKRYHVLFEDAPTPLWEIDMSALTDYANILPGQKREPLVQYLRANPLVLEEIVGRFRVLDANKAAVEHFGATSKAQVIRHVYKYLTNELLQVLGEQIAEIYCGKTSNELETVIRTLQGQIRNINLQWTIVPGHEESFSKVLIATMDITERKQAQEELEHSEERLRALARHLHHITERERTSIARDVHDELGGALTSLKIDLTVMEKHLRKNTLNVSELLDEIREMKKVIDSTIHNVRQVVRELRPEMLDNFGLTAALELQSQEFKKRTGLKVDFKVNGFDLCRDDRSIGIFRIFQEALTNIARHANATSVNIILSKDRNGSFIEISDDGIGIPPEKIRSTSTFGLIGMQERALMIGAEVAITGAHNRGTTVRLSIPNGEHDSHG